MSTEVKQRRPLSETIGTPDAPSFSEFAAKNIVIYAQTKEGTWLPLYLIEVDEEKLGGTYKLPLSLKVRYAGQDSQSISS